MKSLTNNAGNCTKSSHTPRVSVLTPIYNTNPAHLREMIESILTQTFTDFEFLILNDSPNNTEIEKIVLEYAKQDNRVKYAKNEHNMGITPSRNKLVKMARGEYLAIFDHDDISVPTRLEKEVAYLDAHPHIGVVSGWLEYFGDDNKVLKNPEHDLKIKVFMTQYCTVAHTAAMIRKSVLVDNNIEYEEFYTPAEDYRLWARLMQVTHFYNFQEVLVKYRWNNVNASVKYEDAIKMHGEMIALDIRNNFPAYWELFNKRPDANRTLFRLRLFGIIPLLKIKNNWVLLFECIPVCKIKWK